MPGLTFLAKQHWVSEHRGFHSETALDGLWPTTIVPKDLYTPVGNKNFTLGGFAEPQPTIFSILSILSIFSILSILLIFSILSILRFHYFPIFPQRSTNYNTLNTQVPPFSNIPAKVHKQQ